MTKRYKYLFGGLLLACLFTLSGCSHETSVGGSEDEPGQPVALRLQIGTESGASALPLTKASRDTKAKDHEFINSLVVFITDANNRIEKVVPFDFTEEETQMKTGDLEFCISEEFTLTTGTKIIYAFANCERLLSDGVLKATSGTQLQLPLMVTWDKGQTWKPNASNGFIPMSAMKEVTIGTQTKSVSIELIRLLSRLEVSFHNATKAAVTVSSWSIGNFNKEISLFKGTIPETTSDWNLSFSAQTITLPGNQVTATDAGYYYVSESAMAGGFSVYVKRDSKGETKYTSRAEIPRNHIWPLEILFSDYQLKIQITGKNPPIGGYPEVTTDATGSTECTIIGGGLFTLTPTLYKQDGTTVVSSVTWSIETSESSTSELVKNLKLADEDQTITGTMAGAANSTDAYTFTLKALKGRDELTSFSVTLKFKDILGK